MGTPHPSNDDRVWAFNKEGRLAPLKGPLRRGPLPTVANPFAWWMYKRHFTNQGLARAIECSEHTIARARAGGRLLRIFVMRLKRRWPDCPIKQKQAFGSASAESPINSYLKRRLR